MIILGPAPAVEEEAAKIREGWSELDSYAKERGNTYSRGCMQKYPKPIKREETVHKVTRTMETGDD